jgi:lipopolysaccharide export LptBFGC system permease protein LptF
MKTNRLIITVILIITGSFLVNLSAQEALKAVAKKCEDVEGVKTSVIRNNSTKVRNGGISTEKKSIIDIRFANNEALKKEILAAFEKDKEQADKIIEDKESGKIVNLHYCFGNTTYFYSENKNGNISFSIMEKFQ